MRRAMMLALGLAATGCLGLGEEPSPGERTWRLDECQSTLHVWVVPLGELAQRTPPEFPPAILREQDALDTPMGRIVFYLYDCDATIVDGDDQGRSLLGLLGIRVEAPSSVAPPRDQPEWAVTPWVSVYLLEGVAGGPIEDLLSAGELPSTFMVGRVRIASTGLPDAPSATAELELDGTNVFTGSMQGTGQVEAFDRPERYFVMPDPDGDEVRWLDVRFNMTLWETEGRVNYDAGTPWAEAVPSRAYDLGVDHHAMRAALDLGLGRGSV